MPGLCPILFDLTAVMGHWEQVGELSVVTDPEGAGIERRGWDAALVEAADRHDRWLRRTREFEEIGF